jgi:hypothetical protein
MSDIQATIHREVLEVMAAIAETEKTSLHADELAIASHPDLFVASAPAGGVEHLDFKSLLDGRSDLDDTPVMHWYLAGAALRDKAFPLDEGFYTVIANQQDGSAGLRTTKGETVAHGDLRVLVAPQAPSAAVAKTSVSGKITHADAGLFPPRLEVCGEVTVKKDGVTVKVNACVKVGF